MRSIKDYERRIAEKLALCLSYRVKIKKDQEVWVVNPEMGSIRASYCSVTCPVYAVSNCEASDKDSVPVVITLLLNRYNKFGELDFWKVNDNPVEDFKYIEENIKNIKQIRKLFK